MKDQADNPAMIEAVCGNCIAWTPVEMKGPVQIGQPKRGVCRGLPATPVPMYDAHGRDIGQRDMHPCPVSSETCLLFTPRNLLSLPAVPNNGH